METTLEAGTEAPGPQPQKVPRQLEAEARINTSVMSIRLTADGLVIRDEEHAAQADDVKMLPGVYCEGVQYYDLKDVQYISNSGMAILIDLLKSLLQMGVEVEFVNVHPNIRKKIREFGLDNIISCGDCG